MARRYSKKKGVSGSTKPLNVDNSEWVNKDPKAVKDVIIELDKAGKSASQIGIILSESHAVPDVKAFFGKSLGAMLTEIGVKKEVPDDLLALIKRDIAIAKHRESNKKDMTAKRGQQLTLSKINKLVDYYKANKVLELDWSYERSKAMQWVV